MNKQLVAQLLREIGILLELKGENSFKARAYTNAARTVETLQEELDELIRENRLGEIKGIGTALVGKISEIVFTGRSVYYEELRKSIPAGVLEMLKIPGIGTKKAQVLYEKLGIISLRELEYACKENRLVDLPGFGGKTQSKVLMGIELLKSYQGQYYYAEALPQGMELLNYLRESPEVLEASLAGSLRRCQEVVRDIDLVAAAEDRDTVVRYFLQFPQVKEVIKADDSTGNTGRNTTGNITADINRNAAENLIGSMRANTATNIKRIKVRLESGIEVDLKVVRPEAYACALVYNTGSREHGVALSKLAEQKGLTFTETGLFKGEERLTVNSEREFYAYLGLQYISPEIRENSREISVAQQEALPTLVNLNDLRGVFHLHTTYSDGSSTLEEMVQEAVKQGFEYVGISDHSQSAHYAGGLKIDDVKRQWEEIAILREKYPQITIFAGIESDIKPDGALDYPDNLLQGFDFVIASVHSHFRMPEGEMTRRINKAMSHHAVTMLGHPTGRILLARPGYALNIKTILDTAKENDVLIELNASPARLDLDWRYFKEAKEKGIMISINPDAHHWKEIADVFFGVAVARKGWAEKEDIFNCYSAKMVKEYLAKKK